MTRIFSSLLCVFGISTLLTAADIEFSSWNPYVRIEELMQEYKNSNQQDSHLTENERDYKIQTWILEKLSAENLKNAEEYLNNISIQNSSVEVVEKKLYYEVTNIGTGQAISEDSTPTLLIKTFSVSGSVFIEYNNTGPYTQKLSELLQGLKLGLLGAKEGEQRKIYIHPDLAYGTSGMFSPNYFIIYEVEVLKANN